MVKENVVMAKTFLALLVVKQKILSKKAINTKCK